MNNTNACPQCQSTRWMTQLPTTYMPGIANSIEGHSLYISLRGEKGLLGKKRRDSRIQANVCADCGHCELSALNPEALWEIYQDR